MKLHKFISHVLCLLLISQIFLTQSSAAESINCPLNSYNYFNSECRSFNVDYSWKSINSSVSQSKSDQKGNIHLLSTNIGSYSFTTITTNGTVLNNKIVDSGVLFNYEINAEGNIFVSFLYGDQQSKIIKLMPNGTQETITTLNTKAPLFKLYNNNLYFVELLEESGEYSIQQIDLSTKFKTIIFSTNRFINALALRNENVFFVTESSGTSPLLEMMSLSNPAQTGTVIHTVDKTQLGLSTGTSIGAKGWSIEFDNANNIYITIRTGNSTWTIRKIILNEGNYTAVSAIKDFKGFTNVISLERVNQDGVALWGTYVIKDSNSNEIKRFSNIVKLNEDNTFSVISASIPTDINISGDGLSTLDNDSIVWINQRDNTKSQLARVTFGTQKTNSVPINSIHRFYQKEKGVHFYTIDESEVNNIRFSNPNWLYEGPTFVAFNYNRETQTCDAGLPVYRFWNASYQVHFYTIDLNEKAGLIQNNLLWKYEDVGFCASKYTEGTVEKVVYRFWSDQRKAHFYTSSVEEKTFVQENLKDFVFEGPVYTVQ